MRLLNIGWLGLMLALALAACSKPGEAASGAASEDESPSRSASAARRATAAVDTQWIQSNWPASTDYFSLSAGQDRIFARTWDALDGGRTFVTSDLGASWTQIGSADTDLDIQSIVVLGSGTLAGTWNGFYSSTTNGATWTPVSPGGLPADLGIRSVAMIDTTLYAGTLGDVYKSSDNGSTWTEVKSGIPTSAAITSFAASGNAILAGSNSGGVFITTNGASSWTASNTGLGDTHVSRIAVVGSKLFAVTLKGMYVSTNNGTSWAADGSGLKNVSCLLATAGQLLAGSDGGGVSVSSDGGVTWASFGTGMAAGARVWSLAASNDHVFAGTDSGIWRATLLPNSAPTVVTPASATPVPLAGSTSNLSALGGDDAGEPGLIYTWAATGPAAVTFSANGSNAAKNTTATFSKAGSYTFQVTVQDQGGLTATSTVVVSVDQAASAVMVSPASATVAPLGTQSFTATALDQFATALHSQPAFTWSASGGGVIDGNGLFTAGAAPGGPYTVTASTGALSGAATVTVAIPNAPPTIATAAAANANPVTGTATVLSVLGADDGGEANLTYTWATVGTPPASVAFGANASNAAKTITATFSKAGSYTLQVTVKDQGNLSATSAVVVTVAQTLTSVVVSPGSASVNTSATLQFTATGRDQFATNLTAQPSFTWSVSGGGTIAASGLFTAGVSAGGPYTVTAKSASVSGSASVTVAQAAVYQINCGGSAGAPFTADQYASGGTARTVTNAITTTGVTNPAPQAVYQSERYGAVTYTIPGLTAGAAYTVRLHFAELYWTASGKRKFNVAINGTTVLSSFDIFASVGAAYKATVKEVTATASTSGQIVIKLTSVTDNATIEGIQIIKN